MLNAELPLWTSCARVQQNQLSGINVNSAQNQSLLQRIVVLPLTKLCHLVQRICGLKNNIEPRLPATSYLNSPLLEAIPAKPLFDTYEPQPNRAYESSFHEQSELYPTSPRHIYQHQHLPTHSVNESNLPLDNEVNQASTSKTTELSVSLSADSQPKARFKFIPKSPSLSLGHSSTFSKAPPENSKGIMVNILKGSADNSYLDWNEAKQAQFGITPYAVKLGVEAYCHLKFTESFNLDPKQKISAKQLHQTLEYMHATPQSMIFRGRSYLDKHEDKIQLYDETGIAMIRFLMANGASQNRAFADIITPLGNIFFSKLSLTVANPDICVSFENLAFGRKALLIPIQQLFGGPFLKNMNSKGISHPLAQLMQAELPIEFARVVIEPMLRYGLAVSRQYTKEQSFAQQIQQHYTLEANDSLVSLLQAVADKSHKGVRQWQEHNSALVELVTKPCRSAAKQTQAVNNTLDAVLSALEHIQTQEFLFIPDYLPLRNLFDALSLLPRIKSPQDNLELAGLKPEEFLRQCSFDPKAYELQKRTLAVFGQEPSIINILYFFSGLPRDTLKPLIPPQPEEYIQNGFGTMYERRYELAQRIAVTTHHNQKLIDKTYELNNSDRNKFKADLQHEIIELSQANNEIIQTFREVEVGLNIIEVETKKIMFGRNVDVIKTIKELVHGVHSTKKAQDYKYGLLALEPHDLQWYLADPYRITACAPPEKLYPLAQA